MTIRRFFQLLYGAFFFLMAAIGILSVLLFINQRNLTKSQRVRFESYLLAQELRQTTDDLTRFARMYVTTGDPRYEKYYWDIVAIRTGRKPRPQHYERIYWDFIAANGKAPRPSGKAQPLQGLMSSTGFTEQEFKKLREALHSSDALVYTESVAMHAVKGLYDDGTGHFTKHGKPNQAMAIRIMHDAAYQREKIRILKPIDEFFAMLSERTAASMIRYEKKGDAYLSGILSMLVILVVFTGVSLVIVLRKVHAPVVALQNQTRMVASDMDNLSSVAQKIAAGDLTRTFAVSAQPLHPVSRDEISELARIHDHMITQLQVAGEAIAQMTGELSSQTSALQIANDEMGTKNALLESSYAKLRELESLRNSLTHMLVHDMRTPLTSIYASLKTIEAFDGAVMSPEGREFLQIVMDSAQELIEMISSMLDVSKMESSKMHLRIGECHIPTIVKKITDELEPLRRNRCLVIDTPESLPVIAADADLLSRVLRNLLGNALKFTPDDASIRVQAESVDSMVRISVSDNGPGIPREYRDRIFEKFGQVEARAGKQKYSTGLGLTFCKLAIEAHDGTIWVESEPGQGSTFHFELPLKGPAQTQLPVKA